MGEIKGTLVTIPACLPHTATAPYQKQHSNSNQHTSRRLDAVGALRPSNEGGGGDGAGATVVINGAVGGVVAKEDGSNLFSTTNMAADVGRIEDTKKAESDGNAEDTEEHIEEGKGAESPSFFTSSPCRERVPGPPRGGDLMYVPCSSKIELTVAMATVDYLNIYNESKCTFTYNTLRLR